MAKANRARLGMFLRRAVPGLRTWEDQSFVDAEGKEYTSNAYALPLIGTCRKHFCDMILPLYS